MIKINVEMLRQRYETATNSRRSSTRTPRWAISSTASASSTRTCCRRNAELENAAISLDRRARSRRRHVAPTTTDVPTPPTEEEAKQLRNALRRRAFYLEPDTGTFARPGYDPFAHFMEFGASKAVHRIPSSTPRYYLAHHPEVAASRPQSAAPLPARRACMARLQSAPALRYRLLSRRIYRRGGGRPQSAASTSSSTARGRPQSPSLLQHRRLPRRQSRCGRLRHERPDPLRHVGSRGRPPAAHPDHARRPHALRDPHRTHRARIRRSCNCNEASRANSSFSRSSASSCRSIACRCPS